MSDPLTVMRWIFFAAAVGSLLQATLLFGWVQRRVVQPWAELVTQAGGALPGFFIDRRFQRGFPLLMAVVFGALWWFLGTHAASVVLHG